MAPETALIQAGVEVDVLGLGRDDLAPDALAAVTAAHPRPDFKNRILAAFTDGMKRRPQTAYGTCNADVLERFDPTFTRDTRQLMAGIAGTRKASAMANGIAAITLTRPSGCSPRLP